MQNVIEYSSSVMILFCSTSVSLILAVWGRRNKVDVEDDVNFLTVIKCTPFWKQMKKDRMVQLLYYQYVQKDATR